MFSASRPLAFAVLGMLALAPYCGAEDVAVPAALVKLIDQLDVPALEAGTVAKLHAQEGARVAEGDILVQLDDTEARFAEQRARVELEIAARTAASDVALRAAERTLQAADAELKRAEETRQRLRDAITETELDRLRLAADQARLAVEKAQQEQAVAALQKDLKRIEADFAARTVARRQATAPFAGTIVHVHKRPGEWVEPGNKLVRLVRLDRLRVEAFLDSARAANVAEGMSVTLTVESPGRPASAFRGTLTFVSPEVDPFNQSVRILAEIDNPNFALQPGQRGTLTIHSTASRGTSR